MALITNCTQAFQAYFTLTHYVPTGPRRNTLSTLLGCLHYQTYLGFSKLTKSLKKGLVFVLPSVEKSLCTPQGGTLIFSYIRRLGSFFFVQNFEFQYFLGFSEKNYIFLGMNILWKFFWGHHKIGLSLVVISMHFRVFS